MSAGELGQQDVNEIERRAALVLDAMSAGGLLHEIAQLALDEPAELSISDVADIILPPKQPGEPKEARWQLIENTPDALKAAAENERETVFALAEQLNMRKDQSLPMADLARIDPDLVIWIVEGGANRTSVVRRELANQAMRQKYNQQEIGQEPLYQVGSDRKIPKERNGKPNPEYAVAQEIASDYLPDSDDLTEFDLNLASALQAGYIVVDNTQFMEGARRLIVLNKDENTPQLILIQPESAAGGLKDAFSAMRESFALDDIQFVIATNGQYRAKDELQAQQWAKENGIDMLPPVAIGDEPGFSIEHNGATITTAERAPMAYINEMVILQRLQQA